MSFAIHWGVEKMNSAVFHIFFLESLGVFPVKSCISAQSSGKFFLNDSKCCSIKGLVGARIRIFSRGWDLKRSIESIMARRVFPVPVGRITMQSFSLQVLNIADWYSLGVNFSSFMFWKN
mgnify:CR=1 FL=1